MTPEQKIEALAQRLKVCGVDQFTAEIRAFAESLTAAPSGGDGNWPLNLFCESHLDTTLTDWNISGGCPLCVLEGQRESLREPSGGDGARVATIPDQTLDGMMDFLWDNWLGPQAAPDHREQIRGVLRGTIFDWMCSLAPAAGESAPEPLKDALKDLLKAVDELLTREANHTDRWDDLHEEVAMCRAEFSTLEKLWGAAPPAASPQPAQISDLKEAFRALQKAWPEYRTRRGWQEGANMEEAIADMRLIIESLASGSGAPSFPLTRAADLDERYTVMELFCGCIVRKPSRPDGVNYLLPCKAHGRIGSGTATPSTQGLEEAQKVVSDYCRNREDNGRPPERVEQAMRNLENNSATPSHGEFLCNDPSCKGACGKPWPGLPGAPEGFTPVTENRPAMGPEFAPDADTRFDKALDQLAKEVWHVDFDGVYERLRRRLLPTLQAAHGMLQECRCGFDPENCEHCSAAAAMEKIMEETWQLS